VWKKAIFPVVMRLLYTSLFYLLIPFILLRLYWRGFKSPEYRQRWTERLAFYQQKNLRDVIWIHAVSVGEAEAVFPLVKRLQAIYPSCNFLVTTTTPTGSARVKAVLGTAVSHVYLPYDLPPVVKRFLAVFKPKIAIIMEKEIWPNLYAQCVENNIPLMVINARLSANSAKGYKKIPALIRPALANVVWVLTQTEEDKQRFIDIGAGQDNVAVSGNLKFDLTVSPGFIQQAHKIKADSFAGRFVWIIASTHEHEERIFLEIFPQLKKQIPELLLVIVPRHPERFTLVKQLAESLQFQTCMRSTGQPCAAETEVYIADTMGELKLLYGAADVSFVGGSMVPVGGHNTLEPAVMGVPVVFGPHMINFKEIANNMLATGAAIQCHSKEEIINTMVQVHADGEYRASLVSNANAFVGKNQGATEKTIEIIQGLLSRQ
jgi:3-deoxy-D-manno-octulosonic-acid transferase